MTEKIKLYPIILAGGRGTRFWPLSRKKRAKQLLALNSRRTMIQETMARLLPLAPARRFWVITNHDLRGGILKQLPKVLKSQVVAEPMGRNTAPAIGLAAFILLRIDPKAVLGLFPSDQVIADEQRFRLIVKHAATLASKGENMVTLGIKPTRPETGYGYIEAGASIASQSAEVEVCHVRRFTEKPDLERASGFLASGNYYWNSGMFVWSAATLTAALREYLPGTAKILEQIADAWGARKFAATLDKLYPKCENISVDYAVAEPRSAKGELASNFFCIPSEFGWNDLGSWAALYEHRTSRKQDANIVESQNNFVLNSAGNYIYAPGKFVAAVGVKGMVVVDTGDALLITTREASQDVGKVVQHLDEKKLKDLV